MVRKTPVPTYAQHCLVAFGGSLTTNPQQDQWQCGIRVRIPRLDGLEGMDSALANPQSYLDSIKTPLFTWFQRAAATTAGSEFMALRSDSRLNWLKVNNIRADGRYLDQSKTVRWDYPTAGAGAGATPNCPPFVTAAISLTTARQRGRAHRGRIFLPLALTLTGDGHMTVTNQTQCNGTVLGLLALLKAGVDTPSGGGIAVNPQPVIASGLSKENVPITGVSTGNVFDIQRRRKEQLLETYVSAAVPGTP